MTENRKLKNETLTELKDNWTVTITETQQSRNATQWNEGNSFAFFESSFWILFLEITQYAVINTHI